MVKQAFSSVDDYIAAQPPAVRPVLRKVRAAIRGALPDAEEGLSYHLPTYRIGGKAVIYFAAWKKHYSVYPVSEALARAAGATTGVIEKGTIRFSYDDDPPVKVIAKLAKLRAKGGTAGE